MKVAVVLPTLGRMEALLHDWLVAVSKKHEIVELKTLASRPVEMAFNQLHEAFLKTECDWAFFLNADEVPPGDALERLAGHDKDVCSGLCFRWTDNGPTPVSLTMKDGRYTYTYGAGLQRIDRVSMSGVLAKRAVLEAIPVGTYGHTKLNEEGTDWGSPGFAFWDAARERGFEVWMDFDVRIHHYKVCDLVEVNDLIGAARRDAVQWVAMKAAELRGTQTDAEIVEELLRMKG
jgi:hypothetical protein